MSQYLVDSDIIIDFLKGEEKAVKFLESLEEIIVSIVTVAEVYQGLRNKEELKFVKNFFKTTKVLLIDEKISQLALKLMERYLLSSHLLILDAIIAATAIRHNLTLITGNLKHFKMIKGLNASYALEV